MIILNADIKWPAFVIITPGTRLELLLGNLTALVIRIPGIRL